MKNLPGNPDIALTKYKIAIFCDSEFFHGKDILKDIDTCIKVVEETIWDTVFEEASNDL